MICACTIPRNESLFCQDNRFIQHNAERGGDDNAGPGQRHVCQSNLIREQVPQPLGSDEKFTHNGPDNTGRHVDLQTGEEGRQRMRQSQFPKKLHPARGKATQQITVLRLNGSQPFEQTDGHSGHCNHRDNSNTGPYPVTEPIIHNRGKSHDRNSVQCRQNRNRCPATCGKE